MGTTREKLEQFLKSVELPDTQGESKKLFARFTSARVTIGLFVPLGEAGMTIWREARMETEKTKQAAKLAWINRQAKLDTEFHRLAETKEGEPIGITPGLAAKSAKTR